LVSIIQQRQISKVNYSDSGLSTRYDTLRGLLHLLVLMQGQTYLEKAHLP
jgi:hypothetical protein